MSDTLAYGFNCFYQFHAYINTLSIPNEIFAAVLASPLMYVHCAGTPTTHNRHWCLANRAFSTTVQYYRI